MTAPEAQAVFKAVCEIDNVMDAMDAELDRLYRALEAGVTLEVIGELNRVLMGAK